VAVEADPAAAVSPSQIAAAAARAIETAVGFAPDAVLVLAPREIPRTPNGKTQHQVLRQQLALGEIERRDGVLFSNLRPRWAAE
jgi:acyl-CoA synthetase (AMP-forming)/AMP-acid ligase II